VSTAPEHRKGPDRRTQARGGRRAEDRQGFAPLVLVAADDAASREISETILARLHFAVAPIDSIEKAVAIIPTLRPDVIVVHARDKRALERVTWPSAVPVVNVTDETREPDTLVEAIRRAIRGSRAKQ
jgi:CheY-like chemotaxis protein